MLEILNFQFRYKLVKKVTRAGNTKTLQEFWERPQNKPYAPDFPVYTR